MRKKLFRFVITIILTGAMFTGCANTEKLQTLLAIQVEHASLYTPASYDAYRRAVEAARRIEDKAIVFQFEVDEAADSLKDSIDGLTLRSDKTELINAKEEALKINTAPYLPWSCFALEEALSNATDVIGDDNALDGDVVAAIRKIEEAIAGLELKPDKTALSDLVSEASSIKEEKYTTVTYNILKEAILDAEEVNKNSGPTQAEVDAAITALQEAIDGLVKSKKCIWRISTSLRRTASNHVGDDWSSGMYYKKEQIWGSFEITAKEGSSITITGEAIEHDNVPDVGSGSVSLILKDGNEEETTFYVRENRGRYAGNRAVWVLTVSCELVERV